MVTIGFIELNSIAKGVEAADAILKAAATKLIVARPCCPGKYHVLFSGEVAAVQSSLDVACSIAGTNLIDKTVIPRIHEQVIQAIAQTTAPEELGAIGIMEYFSITAAVYGADAAAKSADVQLIDVRLGTGIGGKSFVVLTGDVAAVEAAIYAGTREAIEQGMLIQQVVIANPRPEIYQSLL
jgi:microcompartment protein CcmL/EutN